MSDKVEVQSDDEHAHPALRDALCRYLDDRADYADRGSLSDDFAELWEYVGPALAARSSADAETLRRVRGLLSPNGIPLHGSKRITVGDIRAALDGPQ